MSQPENTGIRPPRAEGPVSTGAYAPPDSGSELVRVLDQYLADLQAGRAPDRARLLAEHPDLVDQLEPCLAGIDFVHRAARPSAEAPACLGDFRLLRELGRGGMGVVYEAEQVSLKRRVAVKVLRFGAVADAEVMRRFQREAETVARLHHTNIVPTFAVGCEQGVHYYAMQLIEGKSLAAVIEEGRQATGPSSAAEVARWGLQAAEALAYAHQRGVIHRDIKPSNLLLDPEGVLWLTDFGLAKRADEVTLTVTGHLLGTPRYMSPEQAAGVKQPIDHRTDIYSLGATLYELATGKPVFDADTPQGILSQIQHTEPVAPRRVRAGLPRDLETIVLKCLAKEPARRYATAQALADDLRAFVDGRPIKARRVSLVERALRWARKERRSAAVAGVAALLAVVLVAGGLVAWNWYANWRLGRVALVTDGQPLKAEFFTEDGTLAAPPVQISPRGPVDPVPVALPAGSYQVRLSGLGRLSETYQVQVERGAEQQLQVNLNDRLLWPPIDTGSLTEVVRLADRSDVITLKDQVVSRLDGASGSPVWKLDLSGPEPLGEPNGRVLGAMSRSALLSWNSWERPRLVRPAPDLDGDGIGDLVWVCSSHAALWAMSGRGNPDGSGKELWRFVAHAGVPGMDPAKVRSDPSGFGQSKVVGQPAVVDVDGDGTPDLIATFVSRGETVWVKDGPGKQVEASPQAWMEAISGRTGRSLWRYQIPWPHEPLVAAEVVPVSGKPAVVFVAATKLIGLDVKTGKERWPVHELGLAPLRPPQFADLNGDGETEVLLLASAPPSGVKLIALMLATRSRLWETTLEASYNPWEFEPPQGKPVPDWPLLADLDGDGKPEIIVPSGNENNRPRSSGVAVLNGADGTLRWQRILRKSRSGFAPQVNHFLVGDDLDGDGRRELFVASLASGEDINKETLLVEALSGRDGRTLWWWGTDLTGIQHSLGVMSWWQVESDGCRQVVIPVSNWSRNPLVTYVLSGGTGRLAHLLPEVADPRLADLDGDGAPDLYYTYGGRLHAVRGTPPRLWQRLGEWQSIGDFTGNGIPDLVAAQGDELTFLSGSDGRPFWTTKVDGQFSAPVIPADVADPTGLPDLVIHKEAGSQRGSEASRRVPFSLQAFSIRARQRLWQADDLLLESDPEPGRAASVWTGAPQYLARGSDGQAKLVVPFRVDQSMTFQLWLALLDARTGRLEWKIPAGEKRSVPVNIRPLSSRLITADLNGDGVTDLLYYVAMPQPNGDSHWELFASSGRDGQLLWRRLLSDPVPIGSEGGPLPVLADLEGDGRLSILVVQTPPREGRFEVLALDPMNGQPRWIWTGLVSPGGSPPWQAPLVLRQDGGKRQAVCIGVGYLGQSLRELILLDASGKELRRQRFHYFFDGRQENTRLWAQDLDGDGTDGLLLVVREENGFGQKVRAIRGDLKEVLWEWPATWVRSLELREIRPAGKGPHGPYPPTVVVRQDSTVFGLNGRTGRPRWQFHTPGQAFALLEVNDPLGLPRALLYPSGATVCQQVTPLGQQGAAPTPRTFAPITDDPRLVRILPWHAQIGGLLLAALVPPLAALMLLIVPGILVVRARRWKWRRLGVLLTLWLLGFGVAFFILERNRFIEVRGSVPGWAMLVGQAVGVAGFGLPAVLFLVLLGRGLIQRRWRRVCLLLAASVIGAALIAAVWLRLDSRQMEPEQSYAWKGWYEIWPLGVYAAGWLLILGAGLWEIFWRLRRVARRLFLPGVTGR